jgi:hypothetical protein
MLRRAERGWPAHVYSPNALLNSLEIGFSTVTLVLASRALRTVSTSTGVSRKMRQ